MQTLVHRSLVGGLIAVALAVAGASGAGAAEDTAGKAAVSVASCKTGELASARTAVFKASMRTVDGASRLQVRFRLQERVGEDGWDAVKAPGLGKWRGSKPGVGAFAYSQRVKALAAGSTYRAVVDYRWLAEDGDAVERATRTSKPCKQGDALPNLTVNKVAARPVADKPRQATYFLTVLNRGTAPAPASNLRLFVDGSTERRVTVPALTAGQAARLSIPAPRCQSTMGAQADPDGLVRESKETDNVRSVPCALR